MAENLEQNASATPRMGWYKPQFQLWYDAPKHSVVDGDESLIAQRRDIETLGKKANFFGNMSRYLWFATLPLLGLLGAAVAPFAETAAVALFGAAGPAIAAGAALAAVIGVGFWASQKAQVLADTKNFETSVINAKTTAKEIAQEICKTEGCEAPTKEAETQDRSDGRRWVDVVGARKGSHAQAIAESEPASLSV